MTGDKPGITGLSIKNGLPVLYKKIIVIGGGPAGMAAALEAVKAGTAPEDILILERDRELGGILNQCIHAGFGIHIFGEELTGPEYAGRFIDQINAAGVQYLTDSMALSLSPEREVSFISPSVGLCKAKAGAVVLAMGCRERTRGALNIPGTRPAGVFSAGTAQRYVNIEGWLPGKRIVILGSGDIGLIMARRLTLEGARVLRVCEIMPYSGGLARNIAQCLDDFGIPLYLSHTVTGIEGRERVEGVYISQVDERLRPIPGTEEYVECDTLLLSVGLIPENELTRGAGIALDPATGGAAVNQRMETSAEGIFACGNALQVHDLVDFVTAEAYRAGAAASAYAAGKAIFRSGTVSVKAGQGVRYVVPQRLEGGELEGTTLFFRSGSVYRDAAVALGAVFTDGEKRTIKKIKKKIVTPGEMEKLELDVKTAEALSGASEIYVEVTVEAKK